MGILIRDALAVLPDGKASRTSIYIQGDSVVSVGQEPEGFVCDRVIPAEDKLVLPGFVNAHTHAYMTPFRNWADDLDFNTWLFERIMPAEDRMASDDAYWGAMLSCMEMIKGGTTCFLDMHMFPHSSVMAAQDSGMRAVISRGLSGGEDDPVGGERRLREAIAEYEACSGFPTIGFMLAPHAPYSCDEGYLRDIKAVADDYDLGIHTHLSESAGEVSNCREKYGVTPIGLFDRCGLITSRTVAAHCVHLTDEDIALIASRGMSVAVNTASNLKLANGVARVPEMQKAGINLCLGTDGASSNNALSVLREMQLITLIHKGVRGGALAVTAHDAFDMATKNGARALGINAGEIAAGKKADLAMFSLNDPALTPLGDPVAALSYSAYGVSADTVIINGEVVLDGGRFTKFDSERVLHEVRQSVRTLGLSEE
jgi:5-methylthioadenosine/S-adenosylhomocysteine deaminase